jgi:type I restriction enzyme S subunit
LESGDILFNRTNSYELVGKTGIFLGESGSFTFASYLIRLRISAAITPHYINLAINSPYFRVTQVEPDITQQTGQANFNGTKLRHTLIPLPPACEQRRIVAKVDELMALCDEMESRLTSAREKASHLAASVVHHVSTV